MKITQILLLLTLPCMLLSNRCYKETSNCHYSLWLNNQSDKDVYVFSSFDYPDTSLPAEVPTIYTGAFVEAHERKSFDRQYKCYEQGIVVYKGDGYYDTKDTLCIFVIDAALVNASSWEQVRQNNQVLKRFDYTIQELKNTDFSIDFP